MSIYETITTLMDFSLVVCLGYCAFQTWLIYRKLPAKQIRFLFWGFLTIALLDIGFVIIDLWFLLPSLWSEATATRDFAELIVDIRIIPALLLASGMYYLRKAIDDLCK